MYLLHGYTYQSYSRPTPPQKPPSPNGYNLYKRVTAGATFESMLPATLLGECLTVDILPPALVPPPRGSCLLPRRSGAALRPGFQPGRPSRHDAWCAAKPILLSACGGRRAAACVRRRGARRGLSSCGCNRTCAAC